MAARLARWRSAGRWPKHPVGANLGKSKVTPLKDAPEDYANSLRALWPHLEFFVVNVSSPNTPNLRELQDKAALQEILSALQEVNRKLARVDLISPRPEGPENLQPAGKKKPILVKIAPDLSWEVIDQILELVASGEVAGIIATNTTITRPETSDEGLRRTYAEPGGLSGRPLAHRSTEVIRYIYSHTAGAVPIIGVGGIFNADDAWEKITAGAALIQLYTGMVYEGPGAAKAVVKGLQAKLEAAALASLREAVGLSCGARR
jgi:dihydroorotate dehydrogenase